jgi:hypothetical protein
MKALDSWARQFGYADFDTYVRTGGSIADAADDIRKRIQVLQAALDALHPQPAPEPVEARAAEQAKAAIVEPPNDEPPDPENAQIQGAEYGKS